MSTPTLLPAILKAAPGVTSLATGDRILSVDANGNPQKISRLQVATPSISATLDTPQWVRVASFMAGAALISISTTWSHNPGIRLLVDLILHANSPSYNNAAVLSRLVNSGTSVINKLRVVVKNQSTSYLDIWYNASGSNKIGVNLIDCFNNVSLLPAMELDAQIPDGYTAKEFSLTQPAWGGG